MNKKIVQASLLALAMAGGGLSAESLHAPLLSGPVRYDFEYLKKNKHTIEMWSNGYVREADKAYGKHGFKKNPLSEIIFGKSSFKIAESFQGGISADHGYTEFRNPALTSVTIAPRVSYTDRGIVLGANWSMPVMGNKGRIGVRASVPVRDVRMEKDVEAEVAAEGDQSMVHHEVRSVPLGGADSKTLTGITNYNLRYLASIKTLYSDGTVKPLLFNTAAVTQLGGRPYPAQANMNTTGNNVTPFAPMLIIKGDNGQPPRGKGGGLLMDNPGGTRNLADDRNATSSIAYVDDAGVYFWPAAAAAAAGAGFGAGAAIAQFTDIPANWGGAGTAPALMLVADTDYDVNNIPEDLWATTIHGASGAPAVASAAAKSFIDDALSYHNTSVGDFLQDRGYVFQTYNLAGLGDSDVELFYSHALTKKVNGELALGVVIPTGAGDKYYGNPFKTFLGNGDHIELKVGAQVAANIFKCFDFKTFARYNFVLESTEHRMATFKDSTIKNLGPKADADVSWGYFTGGLDVTMYHPKTTAIATTIGYELYYKTEDKVNYKEKTMTGHFLGRRWTDLTTHQPVGAVAGPNPKGWEEFAMELDGKKARAQTERIAHRMHVEGSYEMNKYLRMSFGGKFTFAGQYAPVDQEVFTGFNVKF